MNDRHEQKSSAAAASELHGFADLFAGHFPGHTMQRLRTPDGRYRYSYVSPDVRETFGLDPDDLMQREFVRHEWVHPQDRQRFIDALETSASDLTVLDEEVRVEQPEGGFKWVRSIGHPRRLEDGTVIWDGVALDVTDRREALEALERALSQARKDEVSEGRFAAIAARDVVRPFERLHRSVEALRIMDMEAAVKPVNSGVIRNLVSAFDDFARTFNAARGLVTARNDDPRSLPVADDASPDRRSVGETKQVRLTRRQREVLKLLQEGATNREIAEKLGIGEGTVKLHVSAILRSLGVKNRTMAVTLGAEVT